MTTSTHFPFDLQRWNAQDLADAVPRQPHQLIAAALANPPGYASHAASMRRPYAASTAPRLFLVR